MIDRQIPNTINRQRLLYLKRRPLHQDSPALDRAAAKQSRGAAMDVNRGGRERRVDYRTQLFSSTCVWHGVEWTSRGWKLEGPLAETRTPHHYEMRRMEQPPNNKRREEGGKEKSWCFLAAFLFIGGSGGHRASVWLPGQRKASVLTMVSWLCKPPNERHILSQQRIGLYHSSWCLTNIEVIDEACTHFTHSVLTL